MPTNHLTKLTIFHLANLDKTVIRVDLSRAHYVQEPTEELVKMLTTSATRLGLLTFTVPKKLCMMAGDYCGNPLFIINDTAEAVSKLIEEAKNRTFGEIDTSNHILKKRLND